MAQPDVRVVTARRGRRARAWARAALPVMLACTGLAAPIVVRDQPATAVARVRPDLDGDGRVDLVVGGYDGIVILEGDGTKRRLAQPIADPVSGTGFGNVVVTADFNRDGYDDLAASDTYVGSTGGVVWIYSGGPHGSLGGDGTLGIRRIEQGRDGLPGASEYGDHFGGSLAAGDVNGDGADDLVIGAMMEGIGTRNVSEAAGAVTVVPGSRSGLRPAGAWVLTQNTPGMPGAVEYGDKFGSALAVGDVTGDGRPDLAVGSEGENAKGMVHLVPSGPGGPTGAGATAVTAGQLAIRASAGSAPDFGSSVAIGDLTGDGRGDLAVGAPYALVGKAAACGAVAVLRGAASGIAAARAQVTSQSSASVIGVCERNDYWGYALAVGDVTGDGRAELVVGAPYESVGALNGGGAYTVLRGARAGVTGTGSFAVGQNSVNVPGTAEQRDRLGESLALVDLDADGRSDVVVGAPGEVGGGGRNTGWVGLLRSSGGGRPTASSAILTGTSFSPAVTSLGRSVASSR